ncbi:esterase/lipase family protein [Haloglomus salinum]|jgi:triacylglycerol lipase|uniref:esterase/lipase family protein n=1 Tax=Haloglomus salinum TaxID=2962673 RepID=UPI0020C9E3DD|nr:alpha/beta fold hydrolase [Haloglomus salinum]
MEGTPSGTRRALLRSATAGTAAALGLPALGSAAAGEDRDSVVLLHGYMDTGDTPWWDVLTGYLEDDGYDADEIHQMSLGDIPGTTTDSPSDYGEVVARELERISDEEGGPVDVIAHSMGGLDTRWAIEKEGAAAHVDDLVTLGSPHQGTYVAYVGVLTEGGRDMIPGSTLLEELNQDGLASGVSYTAVWSHADELIAPSPYASIPEYMLTDATGRNINSGIQEHIQLLVDRSVFDQYIGHLG